MHWMLMPFRRYADFSGRSRRKEYWMFILLNVLISCALVAVIPLVYKMDLSNPPDLNDPDALNAMMTGLYPVLIVYCLYSLVVFIPSLAVAVRRLHDTNKSGWMILLGLIPLIGAIILLVFYCTEGTRGPNRFGPDPKAEDMDGTFA